MENSPNRKLIDEFITNLAKQMGLNISPVSIVDGRTVGCVDAYLLNIMSKGKTVSVLAYQSEMDNLKNGSPCARLEVKIRSALSRLSVMLAP